MITTVIVLGSIAIVSALLLYFVSKKFEVYEDPRIGEVSEVLPQANCGGCGFPGCGGFASACVGASSLDGLYCPVGGAAVMGQVADILGMASVASDPLVAVLRCNGNCSARPKVNEYQGAKSCKIAASLYSGETGCSFGCLGLGDCEVACDFDALYVNPETGLPVIDEEKCTACGACVKACPKLILELRKIGPKSRRIHVSCVNKDKGGAAMKACKNACIGCSKCFKECNFGAITIENNLSYIDFKKCKLCRKCVSVCPTKAIHELNFPAPKPKPAPKPVEKEAKANTSVATENKSVSATKTPVKESTPTEVKKEVVQTAAPLDKKEETAKPSVVVEKKEVSTSSLEVSKPSANESVEEKRTEAAEPRVKESTPTEVKAKATQSSVNLDTKEETPDTVAEKKDVPPPSLEVSASSNESVEEKREEVIETSVQESTPIEVKGEVVQVSEKLDTKEETPQTSSLEEKKEDKKPLEEEAKEKEHLQQEAEELIIKDNTNE